MKRFISRHTVVVWRENDCIATSYAWEPPTDVSYGQLVVSKAQSNV